MGETRSFIFVCSLLALLLNYPSAARGAENVIPILIKTPPYVVEFSNSSGAILECQTSDPKNKIEWFLKDGNPVTEVVGLRRVDADGKLIISPFSAESYRQDVHSSTYKCAASNNIGTIASHDVKVKAVVLQPYDVYVYDVYAIQGNTAVIRCHIPSFLRAYVNVTAWIRDSVVEIKSTEMDQNSKYSLIPNGELFVKDVDLKDSMTSFQCQTYNRLSGEVVKSSMSGKLIVTEPRGNVPPKVLLTEKYITVKMGESAFLPCEVQANPPSQIRWEKIGSQNILKTGINNRHVQVSGSLVIRNVVSSDNGTYKCSAHNSAGHEQAETNLLVIEPLQVAMEFDSVTVDVGKPTSFGCRLSGAPIKSVTWLKNGKLFSSDKQVVLNDGNLNVHILSATADDKGIYQCCMKNEFEAVCGSTLLLLGDEPPIFLKTFQTQTKQPGEIILLKCTAKGTPTPILSWFLDGTELKETNHLKMEETVDGSGKVDSELKINNAVSEDGGLYKCLAKNQAGSVYHWARVNVYGALGERESPPQIVVNGGTAILNCPVYGYPTTEVKWIKDDVLLPSDFRQFQELNGSLLIQDVHRIKDKGMYSCTVKGLNGDVVQAKVQLNVLVAPKLSPFSFQDELVQEGSRGRLQCVVVEGDAPLKIKWQKDGKVLPPNLGITVRDIDEFSSILAIPAITPRHNGQYSCLASNAAGTASFSTILAVNVPPKIVPFEFQDEHLVEGSLLRVSCVVSRGDLPLVITWLKDGKKLPDSVSVKEFDSYSTVLSIDPVKSEHTGSYTCRAQNQAGIATYSAELIVQVPPKWTIQPTSQTVEKGNTVYYHCEAEGYPKPKITWMFAKDLIGSTRYPIHTNDETSVLTNGTLILRDINKQKEGHYLCLASNGIGLTLSAIVQLSVLAPPVFLIKSQSVDEQYNANVTLLCDPMGDTPINITWYNNDQLLSTGDQRRYKTNANASKLIIEHVTRKDSSRYSCEAKNKYGSDRKDFFLTVQEPPEAPILEPKQTAGNRSVFLTWSKPYDGNSEITHYLVQYKKHIDNWQLKKFNVTVDGFKTAVKVTNLLPATKYTFRLAAINAVGTSKFGNEITETTDTDVPTGKVQNAEVESIDGNTLRITWKAPRKDTWNGAIRGYNIGYRIDGSNEPYEFSALEVPEDYTEDLIYQITNLNKYTTYVIVIQTYNDKGAGPLSEPMLSMTSEDVPSFSPEGLRCSALSSKSIYVLWDPLPTDKINGILRGYKVFFKSLTEWYDAQMEFKTSEKEKITLQNLEVNTNYSISVVAFTKVGDGIRSEPVYCKTHEDVPDRPNEIKVLPSSSDSVVVSWKPPKRINGDLIKYNIYYRPLSESEELGKDPLLKTEQAKGSNVHTFQSDAEFFEVKGLKKNQKYAFWVSATSAIGEGHSSDVIAQTVADSTIAATSASFDGVIHTPWKRDITLPCRAVGIPPPQRKWSFGHEMIPIGGRRVLLSDGTLLINKVDNDDSGNYTCTIYNSHGKDHVQYSLNVQVPPGAPILDIVSKSRSSIQFQWRAAPNGGDPVKGYILNYRRDGGDWDNMELNPDKEIFTLNNLACGVKYQVYMEAFNKIGKGLPCDIVHVSTEGSEMKIPTKDQLLHEGSTYVSVHLENWPVASCPVRSFQVEYKTLYADSWTTVSNSIRPTQRKLVIQDLVPATWYSLRVTAHTNGNDVPAEYKFATRTVTGVTIPPPEITIEEPQSPVYIFYLDPYIFIPSVALLIVVIITAVTVCLCWKKKNGSAGCPSDYGTVASTWQGTVRGTSSYPQSALYATIPHQKHRGDSTMSPYSCTRVGDYFPDSDAWVETRTLTRGNPRDFTLHGVRVLPHRMSELMQHTLTRPSQNSQETAFATTSATVETTQSNQDYDQPPKGM